jgi:hypothetical protein
LLQKVSQGRHQCYSTHTQFIRIAVSVFDLTRTLVISFHHVFGTFAFVLGGIKQDQRILRQQHILKLGLLDDLMRELP